MELTLERLEERRCFAVDYPTTPIPEGYVSSSVELFPDTVVADVVLDGKYTDYNTDGISFTEMKDLLISSENDDGFSDRFEILQLKRHVRLGSLPDYVEYLAGAVVNGHFANAEDATTSSLVDKWFNGKDLPDARSEYQRVQGGLEEIRIKGASKEAHIALLAENKPITIGYRFHTHTFESYDPVTDTFFLRNPYQRSHIEATWEELKALPIVSPAHGGYVFVLSPNAPIE